MRGLLRGDSSLSIHSFCGELECMGSRQGEGSPAGRDFCSLVCYWTLAGLGSCAEGFA